MSVAVAGSFPLFVSPLLTKYGYSGWRYYHTTTTINSTVAVPLADLAFDRGSLYFGMADIVSTHG